MTDLLCLHGFIPAGSPGAPPDLAGMDGGRLEEIGFDDFRAICSRVDAEIYDTDRIEERMQDLGWLAARGLEHERVVSWFVDHGQILPVPLLTLYRTALALREAAAAQSAAIAAQLSRFAGRAEWDLKISYDAERLAARLGEISEEMARLDTEIETAPPGRRYLLEKKRAGAAREQTAAAAQRLADEVLADLEMLAEEVRPIPLPRARDLAVVLYAAVLLDGTRAGRAAAAIERHATRLQGFGMRIDYSGPWAPYRFVSGPS